MKLSVPDDSLLISRGMSGGPGTSDPTFFRCSNISLKGLLAEAFAIAPVQIDGPGWIGNELYNVSAKVPADSTREEFRGMLRNLLRERLAVAVRHEQRDKVALDLIAIKGKVKLESASAELPDTPKPIIPQGRVGRYRPRQDMASLASFLSTYLGTVVRDKTDLPGEFVVNMSWAQADAQQHSGSENEAGPSLEGALREQLGLQLRRRRGPIDYLVVTVPNRIPARD